MLLKFINKLIESMFKKKNNEESHLPLRKSYNIEKTLLSAGATKIIQRLQNEGFEAYYVGGCLRDIVLKHRPKDFDVVTNARPEQIAKLFSSAIVIGRRFKLVHIRYRNELIEVATFRKNSLQLTSGAQGIVLEDNTYGTLEDDVVRRDFTVNALYYDPIKREMIDYVGGLRDAKAKLLKTIGNEQVRFSEDPVRIIRAIRYANKLKLILSDETKKSIKDKGSLILHVPKARLYEEFIKCFSKNYAPDVLDSMNELNIARFMIPKTLLNQGKIKKIKKLLGWVSTLSLNKDHQLILIILAFIAPSLPQVNTELFSKILIQSIKDFQQLILIPKQLEFSIRSILLNERIPVDLKNKIRPIPEQKNLKVLIDELFSKI